MSGERERLRSAVADLIYARIGWTKAAEGASVDIADLILADRKRILEECAVACEDAKINVARCRKLQLTEQAWEEAQYQCAGIIRGKIQEHMPKE